MSAEIGQARRRRSVRDNLFRPLIEQGMRKQKRMTVEDLEAFLDRLELRLAYLSEEHFPALLEIIARHARGEAKNVWPDEVSIVNFAHGLQEPPAIASPLVRNYMRSAPVREAWPDNPYRVQAIYRWLRTMHCAPRATSWPAIEGWERDLREKHDRIAGYVEGECADDRDREWLRRWREHRVFLGSLINPAEEGAE